MKQKTITKSLLLLGTALTGLFVSLNHSSSVSAYSLTVSTSGSVTANVMPSADGGIGTTVVTDNVSIISNCRAGYTMTIAGPTDNNLYLNGDSTNNTSGTYFSPVNGTSALNNSANANKWGYSLTANSGTGVFKALTSTPTTLKTPSQTASPNSDIDTTIPVYYGTAVNTSMAPGSYTFSNSNSITYSVVMDTSCTSYSVQYQANGADNPNGMGTTDSSSGEKSVHQINIVEDTKITLLAPNFKKTGYAFLGWSTDQNAYAHFADNDNTNDPVIYGPMEDVIIDADIMATANSRNQINMYAVWIPALKDGGNNPVYMQEWDNPNTTLPHDGCSTLTATVFDDTVTDEKGKIIATKDSVVALTDKRDNMIYTVARLADGNCWMTENLRLEAEYTMGINQNDSTVTNQYLSQGYGMRVGVESSIPGYGNFVGLANSENILGNYSNSVYKADYSDDVYDPDFGTLEDVGSGIIPRYNNDNTANMIDSPTWTQDYSSLGYSANDYRHKPLYSYGNYYSQIAALANTMFEKYYASSGAGSSENTGTSICPAGWNLPSGGDETKEYGALTQSYGGTGGSQGSTSDGDIISGRMRSFPNGFVLSGEWRIGTGDYRGEKGRYWSGTAGFYNYNLAFVSNNLNPSNHDSASEAGFSVRCLVNPTEVEIVLDSNNGSGVVTRVYGVPGETIYTPQSSMNQRNYHVSSWNTAPDGSGTSYVTSYNSSVGFTGTTLYAQYSPKYKVIYMKNCMTWVNDSELCTSAPHNRYSNIINLDSSGDGSLTLGSNTSFSVTGWKIKEYTTNADGTGAAYGHLSEFSVVGASAGDTITLYAHWVPKYNVQYDGNGADNTSTGMGVIDAATGLKGVYHSGVGEGDTFDLFASNFKRDGYGFVGWSTDANAWDKLVDNDTTNDVKIWGPNETITAPPSNGTSITTLFAIWAPAETSNGNPVYLQGWTGCSSMTATIYDSNTGTLNVAKNSVIALTDQRDNQVYAVARLADGNCWMIENLRLSTAGTVGNNVIDNTVTNQSLAEGYGGVFEGLADAESTYFSNVTTENSLYNTTNITGRAQGSRFPRYNESNQTWNNNSTSATTPTNYQSVSTGYNNHANFDNYVYSYGNYYSWAAAIANTNNFSNNSSTTTSICPTGWHIPYGSTGTGIRGGNTSGGFYYFANIMDAVASNSENSNKYRSFPNNFIYSGKISNSSFSGRGGSIIIWSSTSYSETIAYIAKFGNDSVSLDATSRDYKYNGNTIRCVKSGS